MSEIKLQEQYQLYVGGQWRDASDGKTLPTYSPSTGKQLASIANASDRDVDDAVAAAHEAFQTWKITTPAQRAKILNQIADLISEHADFLARVESSDNGKPLRETLAIDIPHAAEHFRYFAGAILADEGSANMLDENTMSLILHEPIGVVGQIIPWNFPFLMAAWKLAPVLASGCCTVLKPSSTTSLSVLELVKLIGSVVPAGVLNVITGSGSKAGNYMLGHEGFSKLAFTGSTEIGCSVARSAADRLIPATLELGGKSANIFFPDCDWEMAMDGLQLGILFNQGQVCCAGSRVFVHEDIYDRFVAEAVARFAKVKIGLSLDQETQLGALVNQEQVEKVLGYVEVAKQEGAVIACGGKRYTAGGLDQGCYVEPTLITNVTNDMRIAQEEIFGPVACVIRFSSEEEVVAMANESEYGLGGAVWTRDINRAVRVARGIETGRVWVNTYNAIPAGAPFGGYKKSGVGRETHKVMLSHYTQMKNILINLSEQPSGFY